jgi:hypothetical protein
LLGRCASAMYTTPQQKNTLDWIRSRMIGGIAPTTSIATVPIPTIPNSELQALTEKVNTLELQLSRLESIVMDMQKQMKPVAVQQDTVSILSETSLNSGIYDSHFK